MKYYRGSSRFFTPKKEPLEEKKIETESLSLIKDGSSPDGSKKFPSTKRTSLKNFSPP